MRGFEKMVELAKARNRWSVNSNEEVPVQKLSDLGKENLKSLQDSELRLYQQIYGLYRTIAQLERKCAEGPMELLKVRV